MSRQRRSVLEDIAHQRSAVSFLEEVIVAHPREGTAEHGVLEVARTVERTDARRKPLPDSKVPRDEGN